MKILLHGLNYAPEEIGIGKYSGEMVDALAEAGHQVVVVTTPPYYPQWKILDGFSGWRYSKKVLGFRDQVLGNSGAVVGVVGSDQEDYGASASRQSPIASRTVTVYRCPLWVPKRVSGLKRVIHLASFALSSIPVVLWKSVTFRPDIVMTVEPAAMCMPTTWLAARLCGGKAWLHVQDFEIDAAFELGILKQPLAKKLVLAAEAFLMRRFDRVSSISPNMLMKLVMKGVSEDRVVSFPNWVDCNAMKPIEGSGQGTGEGTGEGTGDRQQISGDRKEGFGIPADKFVALYAGNIGAKQGLEIIAGAARLLANHERIHFVICGTGAAVDQVTQEVQSLANVQMLPPQSFEQFNELMNCADVHLLPQRSGAADLVMPSKLTGMLATGRAVVACADAGTQIADVVAGHGKVVPAGDTGAFANAVETLAADPAQCQALGRTARQYAVDHLSRHAILSQFISDLRSLVGVITPLDEQGLTAASHEGVESTNSTESTGATTFAKAETLGKHHLDGQREQSQPRDSSSSHL